MGQRMSTNDVAEQVKSSAIRAGLFASIFFLACLVLDLPRWVLDPKWRTYWRMAIGLAGTLSGAIFAATFVSIFLGLRTSDCRKETAVRSFGATVFGRIVWAGAGPSVLLFWWLGGFGDHHDPILMLMLSIFLGLVAFFRWPRAITLNEVGISQRSLFGIRRAIPYREVEYIRYEPKRQTTYVVGPAVTTVTHTLFHSDRELFHSLLEERTKKEVQVPG
jgi:hypothetical protein